MDTQLIMSVTANVAVSPAAIDSRPWEALVPSFSPESLLAEVVRAMERPRFTLKSRASCGSELRCSVDERWGIAGIVRQGVVRSSFPLMLGGSVMEVEILATPVSPDFGPGYVRARWHGVPLEFFDPLLAAGVTTYEVGRHEGVHLNALALSLRNVAPPELPDDIDSMDVVSAGLRYYVPRAGGPRGEGIFQSVVEGALARTRFSERELATIPVSLGEREKKRLTVDLFAAPELLALPSPVEAGVEIAGVLWLHGYSASAPFPTS